MSATSLGLGIIVVLLLATVALSSLAMTMHSSERDITVPPYSHYTLRFNVYGLGFVDYSVEAPGSAPLWGFALLVMNEENYKLYSSGETYQTIDLVVLSPGASVDSSESGIMWVKYLVFQNSTPMTVTLTIGYTSIPVFSLMFAVPIFVIGFLAFMGMARNRNRSEKQVQTSKLGHQ